MTTIAQGMICPVFEDFSIGDDGVLTLVDIDGFTRAVLGGGAHRRRAAAMDMGIRSTKLMQTCS